MKQVLDAAGIRTPWHAQCATLAEVWEAAERIGYPLIVKPIDGRGLGRHLPGRLGRGARRRAAPDPPRPGGQRRGVRRGGGVHLRHGVRERPDPVRERLLVPPAAAAGADARVDQPDDGRRCATSTTRTSTGGRAMGRQRLDALGFQAGFTHMEWYRKADGEVVFGEIGARPPGRPHRRRDELRHRRRPVPRLGRGRACTAGLAGRWSGSTTPPASSSGREGSGRITRIDGPGPAAGASTATRWRVVDLLPVGRTGRDWRAT